MHLRSTLFWTFIFLGIIFCMELSGLADDKFWQIPGGGIFQDGAGWSPNGMPTASDHAWIGNLPDVKNNEVESSTDITMGGLSISNGMQYHTGVWQLGIFHKTTVLGITSISGFNQSSFFAYLSKIAVWNAAGSGPDFTTGGLTIKDRAEAVLNGGTLQVNGLAYVDGTSAISGRGTIRLTSNQPTALILDGDLFINDQGMTINQLGSGRIDLDGGLAGDKTIRVNQSTGNTYSFLTINGTQLADDFDDHFRIAGGHQLNMNLAGGWTMGSGGELTFEGGAENAQVNGGAFTMNGKIAFAGTGLHGQINAPLTLNPTASMTLGTQNRLELANSIIVNGGSYSVGAVSQLDFGGTTTVRGGIFNTAGTGISSGAVRFLGSTEWKGDVNIDGFAIQQGNATVSGNTTITANRFDFDGASASSWTINSGLTVNADAVESFGVNLQNQIDDAVIINGNNLLAPAFLQINLPVGQNWVMAGDLTLVGPGGSFSQTTLRGSDVEIAGAAVALGNNTSTARITLGSAGVFGIADASSLRLEGGSLADTNRIRGGEFVGPGTLAAGSGKSLSGFGTINNSIDFDGTAELRAAGGKLTLNGTITDVGTIGTGDANGDLHFNSAWNSNIADKVQLRGGMISGGQLVNDGLVTGFGKLAMQQFINNGELSAVDGSLHVELPGGIRADMDGTNGQGVLRVEAGNLHLSRAPADAFDGTAYVGPGRTLQLDEGWEMRGDLFLTGGPDHRALIAGSMVQELGGKTNLDGTAEFRIPTVLASSSHLQFSLEGFAQGEEFDWLIADEWMSLDGTLDLSLVNGFESLLLPGQTFEIISVQGALNGTFDWINQPAQLPVGWHLDAVYGPHSVQLLVVGVPEPAASIILIPGLLAGLACSRFRRNPILR